MSRSLPIALGVALTACVSGSTLEDFDAGEDPLIDSGSTRDAGRDAPSRDTSTNETGNCTLGTPDRCGTCETKCPGLDDARSERTCSDATSAGTCGITCKGEAYDLDGQPANGCEAEDLPVQDTEATAVATALTGANLNVTAQIYGDGRPHDAAPTSRPLGREDWFKVTATGGTSAMTACLSISNFPADNTYEVCISGDAQNTFPSGSCKAVTPASQTGAERCVSPPAPAPSSGVFLVRIRKSNGSNTPNKYALYLAH
jgi:hypothetical protein